MAHDLATRRPTTATFGSQPARGLHWTPARVTRSLLGYGVIAGPIYVVSVLVQGLTRPGFDLARHDASLLSNGDLGWIQILTFVLTGAMVITFSIGLARAFSFSDGAGATSSRHRWAGGAGSGWAPRLIGLYGLGLIGAGIFVADPMNGFPPGTPVGQPDAISLHGLLHIVSAAVGFLGLVAGCLVTARRFASEARPGWALFSRITAIVFLAAFVGVASGSSNLAIVAGFWFALVLAWTWMAALGIHLYRRVTD